MNDPLEKLEFELKSLRPVPVSPGLRRRIAASLKTSHQMPLRSPRRLTRRVLAGAVAVAACLVGAVILFHNTTSPELQTPRPAAISQKRNENPPPTLSGYHQALNEGNDAFGKLLDYHASIILPPEKTLLRVNSFARLHKEFNGTIQETPR